MSHLLLKNGLEINQIVKCIESGPIRPKVLKVRAIFPSRKNQCLKYLVYNTLLTPYQFV